MNLTEQQKRLCEQVINVFETGSTAGNYSTIAIYQCKLDIIEQCAISAADNI